MDSVGLCAPWEKGQDQQYGDEYMMTESSDEGATPLN